MLQLSQISYLYILYDFFINIYVLSSHVRDFLCFYPVGIALSLYVLAALSYMIIKCSKIFTFYFKLFSYYITSFYDLLDYFSLFFRIVSPLIRFLHFFLSDIIKNFAEYQFVFNFKRAEFYIFCFIVVALCS